jgi:deoxyribonuclease V
MMDGRMRIRALHPWQVSPREAVAIQKELRRLVETADRLGEVRSVAGVDVSVDRCQRLTQAAVAVLSFPELALCDSATARRTTDFPYVPGLLSFREMPAVLQALEGLEIRPDLLLCDGQGFAHPRRFGLACHLGVVTDTPTVGVAKTRLIGTHDEVGPERGSSSPLLDQGEVVGMVVRTRANVKPVYVSIGHRVSLETAVDFALRTAPRFRLPEPARWAHRLASLKG